uniref:Uncharacterized protein n=1 Tax=Anopheles culicifacies TaxID=139723 RepID=A0A182M2V2_9DIPT
MNCCRDMLRSHNGTVASLALWSSTSSLAAEDHTPCGEPPVDYRQLHTQLTSTPTLDLSGSVEREVANDRQSIHTPAHGDNVLQPDGPLYGVVECMITVAVRVVYRQC